MYLPNSAPTDIGKIEFNNSIYIEAYSMRNYCIYGTGASDIWMVASEIVVYFFRFIYGDIIYLYGYNIYCIINSPN